MEVIDKIREMKIPQEQVMLLMKYVCTEINDITDVIHVHEDQFLVVRKSNTEHMIIKDTGLEKYVDPHATDIDTVMHLVSHYKQGFSPLTNEKITYVKEGIFFGYCDNKTYMFNIENGTRKFRYLYKNSSSFYLQIPREYDEELTHKISSLPVWNGYWVDSKDVFRYFTMDNIIQLYKENDMELLSLVFYDMHKTGYCSSYLFKCDLYRAFKRVTLIDNSFCLFYEHKYYSGNATLIKNLDHLYASYSNKHISYLLYYVLTAGNKFVQKEMRLISDEPDKKIFRVLYHNTDPVVYNLCFSDPTNKIWHQTNITVLPTNTDKELAMTIYNMPEVAFTNSEFLTTVIKTNAKLPPIKHLVPATSGNIVIGYNIYDPDDRITHIPLEQTPTTEIDIQPTKQTETNILPTVDELNASGLKKFQENLAKQMRDNDITGCVTLSSSISNHILTWLTQYCNDNNINMREITTGIYRLTW